nr:MAG TPA: hypothetical protein [Caudoviricetes sp.]
MVFHNLRCCGDCLRGYSPFLYYAKSVSCNTYNPR